MDFDLGCVFQFKTFPHTRHIGEGRRVKARVKSRDLNLWEVYPFLMALRKPYFLGPDSPPLRPKRAKRSSRQQDKRYQQTSTERFK